jgi:hypothetical protein
MTGARSFCILRWLCLPGTHCLHQSRLDQKRLRIFPEGQMLGIPASMATLIENERGMRGGRREPPTLLPRDEAVFSAVDHQHRSREMRDRGQIVEVIAKEE